ncbi:TonB-dependent receptor [Sphingomonas morindae]|uniref:TonB-dependent receptor n=1 Tax=Sphingomonas morindae TaxID=1541170 RepID=A0ABY4X6A9_9SPHN|nr:TonB-dependent receptor [Sphingomonas morindae]USI72432.1 TonB-dependent receptor [Sphingomonas morindae]
MPTVSRGRRTMLLAGALPAFACAGLARAETPQAVTTADAPATNEGDILVTARRREETVQKVPLAISVIGGKTLDATGTFNVLKLTQIQPSLQFYSTNPRNTTLNIRGLGSPFGLTNDGIEQGVGIYVDDVYNSRVAASTFDFVDIERVEVLRGPQGTLYGKNTTAGAINITTRAPSFSPEARGELSFGNLDFVQAKASVSAPLVADRLAFRLSGALTSRRGTIYNVTTDKDVNGIDNKAVRGQLLFRATDTLDLTLAGDYNRQDPDCCAQIYVRTGATQRPLNRQYAALAAAFNYRPPSFDAFDRLTDLDVPLRARQEIGGASLRARWQIGPGTLTSVSAWRFWNWDPSNDRDFLGLPITTVSANPSRQRQWTQEIRYAGSSGRIDYVGGLFAFHQTLRTTGEQAQGPAASRWLLNPSSAAARDPSVLNGLRSDNDIRLRTTSLAAFGQIGWHVTDRLRLQPGLRVNYDRKSGAYLATVTTGSGSTSLTADQRGVLAPQSYQPRFSAWNLSGDFTASYDLTQALLLYATYARGFKSGGINLSGLPLDAANQPILSAATVKPEREDHVEAGLKSQWFDKRLTLNLAAFWTDVHNYQATVTNGQLGVLRGYLANAGLVRTRGVELEAAARPSTRLSLYANGSFTDARYVHFRDAPCPPELSGGSSGATASPPGTPGGVSPAACDISGQWLPGVSRWSAAYGGEYSLPGHVADLDGRFYLGVDGSYRSRFSSNPSRSRYTDIAGYALLNLRLGFRFGEGWDVFGWVRNALDKNYYEVLATQSGNTGLIVGQPAEPRTFGGTIRASF